MKAAVLHEFGRAPRWDTFPTPEPGDGEVLVRMTGASLKNVDRLLARGEAHALRPAALPAVCGVDGVGRLPDGDRVFFLRPRPPFGTMAEYAVVPRRQCFPIPAGVDDVTAAALPNPALSAYSALVWRAGLQPGESVLVLGATGATGQAAVQTARSLGAGRIVAAGRNPRVLDLLSERGADTVIALDQPQEQDVIAALAAAGPYDVVVDYLWGRPTELFFAALEHRGYRLDDARIRHVGVGHMAGMDARVPVNLLTNTGLEISGNGAGTPTPVAEIPAAIAGLFDRAARGELQIETEAVPLADVTAAWSRDSNGRRVVFVP